MKLIISSALVFASSALASYDDIVKHVLTVLGEDDQTKSINIPDLAAGYGCYCMFSDITGAGRSDPKDAMDTVCKQLNDAYACIAHEEDNCNPATVAYNPISSLSTNSWNDCAMANNGLGACAVKTCAAEHEFGVGWSGLTMDIVRDAVADGTVVQLMANGGPMAVLLNDALKHANMGDYDVACPKGTAVTFGDKQCCGSYPNKFPYRDQNGARQCCDSSVFNTATHQCCNDVEVKLAGASC